MTLNGKSKLLELYEKALNPKVETLSPDTEENLEYLSKRLASNKGVYTVLITLGVYKLLNPSQDIRYHKIELENGFSGRSFDTTHITPTLKSLGLLSMAESGWLTRSLEQAYPYDKDFNGKITPITLKETFLYLVEQIQFNENEVEKIVIRILKYAIEYRKLNTIKITPIQNIEALTIDKIVHLLDEHFKCKYTYSGGSKLPVLAFYSIYKCLIPELKRFDACVLGELGSHTASDKTSKSSGDIEIFKNSKIFESIEIKHDRFIDSNILRIAQEKIYKFNPTRYYILSFVGINEDELSEINQIINDTREQHGCQIIVNGIMHTLKYYLRLISSLDDFLKTYISLIEEDEELKIEHKSKLQELFQELDI